MWSIVGAVIVLFLLAVGLKLLLDYIDYLQGQRIARKTKSPNSVFFPQWPPE